MNFIEIYLKTYEFSFKCFETRDGLSAETVEFLD